MFFSQGHLSSTHLPSLLAVFLLLSSILEMQQSHRNNRSQTQTTNGQRGTSAFIHDKSVPGKQLPPTGLLHLI